MNTWHAGKFNCPLPSELIISLALTLARMQATTEKKSSNVEALVSYIRGMQAKQHPELRRLYERLQEMQYLREDTTSNLGALKTRKDHLAQTREQIRDLHQETDTNLSLVNHSSGKIKKIVRNGEEDSDTEDEIKRRKLSY